MPRGFKKGNPSHPSKLNTQQKAKAKDKKRVADTSRIQRKRVENKKQRTADRTRQLQTQAYDKWKIRLNPLNIGLCWMLANRCCLATKSI